MGAAYRRHKGTWMNVYIADGVGHVGVMSIEIEIKISSYLQITGDNPIFLQRLRSGSKGEKVKYVS